MDMRAFINAFSYHELNELSNIIYDKQKEYAKQFLQPLDDAERTLIGYGYFIDAIKQHRQRTGSTLMEAKMACDIYKESY
jgi:hypothetical protein